jgi:hypothetical protein
VSAATDRGTDPGGMLRAAHARGSGSGSGLAESLDFLST